MDGKYPSGRRLSRMQGKKGQCVFQQSPLQVWFGWEVLYLEFYLLVFLFVSLFWPNSLACGVLVPWPGTELAPPAVRVWILSLYTFRDVPPVFGVWSLCPHERQCLVCECHRCKCLGFWPSYGGKWHWILMQSTCYWSYFPKCSGTLLVMLH